MTRHLRTLVLAVCAAVGLMKPGAASADGEVTTSYHIGNSLTWDSQPRSLASFAAMREREHAAGYHILTGAALYGLVDRPDDPNVSYSEEYGRFDTALVDHAWTAVTMQSHNNAGSTIGTDLDSILDLIDLTRSNPANAATKFYIYAGWPQLSNDYQQAWNVHVDDDLSTPSARAGQYYTHLINRVRAATDAEVYMIPMGEVLSALDLSIKQNGIPGYNSINQFYSDGLHMNNAVGRYTAAVTTFATLLEEEPRGLTRPPDFIEWPVPIGEEVYAAINEVVRSVLNASTYTGVEFLDPPLADFDGSGRVDDVDLTLWQGAAGKTAVGDADGDQIVDGTDFLAWQRRLGADRRRSENFDLGDVNVDGLVDSGDLEFWRDSFGASEEYDVDADGVTDGADFLQWQRRLTPPAAEDFDGDGLVNGPDMAWWKTNFGFNLAPDANGDGVIDNEDFLIWQQEEGRVWPLPDATMAAVPEPATWALALVGLMALVRRRR